MNDNNDKTSVSVVDTRVLQRFSHEVLGLAEIPRCPSSGSWLHAAIQGFGNVVSFDTAWWGQVYLPTGNAAPKNLMHGSLGLGPSFAEEWNRIAEIDRFANVSISQLGKAIRCQGDWPGDEKTAVGAFCERHDIYHSMAVTLDFPASGMLFFVSIYRGRSRFGFDEVDALLMEEFVRHLARCWQAHLTAVRSDAMSNDWGDYALSSRQGELLYIGREVGTALDAEYAGWQGSSLPGQLSGMLDRAPCTLSPTGGKGIVVQPCGELVSLMMCSRRRSSVLSPRELSAARLYSQGSSYKEVARTLGITPATARTYLRNAYVQLGVSNKVELISALRQPGGE
ncbi:helix-turn-helix transcriptional regulator [Billgrantia aerodenitrificans]|uniref:Helix-turn-helix transcriptional regulator n=1 Tax=Billgrantia aerodenitrificans TaxID=2733483 RepID=A0ABS9AXD1_9GAMM|nr:helix-turn-helix transcriptional regulator [Halomonas aerodenitrificans]MCE8026257.1 helix-turn-helix transcriptional regulator [Halomonas aerodenitrificans]